MGFSREFWLRTFAYGAGIAIAIALVAAFLDWRANPAGLFHDQDGTNWPILGETWLSWFLPLLPATCGLSALLLGIHGYWRGRKDRTS
jgi:H+/Cl- antiporter ClcA